MWVDLSPYFILRNSPAGILQKSLFIQLDQCFCAGNGWHKESLREEHIQKIENKIMKKPLTTKFHGMFDYPVGLLLLLAPNIFGFANVGGAAVWVPRSIGIVILLQSLLTRYEMGMIKVLPMRLHLINDYLAGALLAVSPWLFGFYAPADQRIWLPHLVVGLVILLLTALTQKVPRHVFAGDVKYAGA